MSLLELFAAAGAIALVGELVVAWEAWLERRYGSIVVPELEARAAIAGGVILGRAVAAILVAGIIVATIT